MRKTPKRAAKVLAAKTIVQEVCPAVPAQPKPVAAPGAVTTTISEQKEAGTGIDAPQVSFTLVQPLAKRVAVCGEFNGWSPKAAPMKFGQDGRWKTSLLLAPGRYQYKFLVDDTWMPDPEARENVWNTYGTLNSVVEVRA